MTYQSKSLMALLALPVETRDRKILNNIERWQNFKVQLALVNRAESDLSNWDEELWIGRDLESIKSYREQFGKVMRTIEDFGVPWQRIYSGFSNVSDPSARVAMRDISSYFTGRTAGNEYSARLIWQGERDITREISLSG